MPPFYREEFCWTEYSKTSSLPRYPFPTVWILTPLVNCHIWKVILANRRPVRWGCPVTFALHLQPQGTREGQNTCSYIRSKRCPLQKQPRSTLERFADPILPGQKSRAVTNPRHLRPPIRGGRSLAPTDAVLRVRLAGVWAELGDR